MKLRIFFSACAMALMGISLTSCDTDIEKIDVQDPVNACKRLITSLMYVVNK